MFFLGVDSGGTFIKAGVYDSALRERAVARKVGKVVSLHPGWAERDLDELWADACWVMREAVEKSGVDSSAIKSVGISAHGKGLYLLGRGGSPLGRGILSADQRALDLVRRWQEEAIPDKLYPLTRQTLWTGHPATLLRWLKENEPERYRAVWRVQMAHDYLRFKMTGNCGCEITNISESNLFNMNQGGFDPILFGMLGIDEAFGYMPGLVGSGEAAGEITAEAAAATGLEKGTLVAGGLFDVAATALCAGLVDATRLNAVMGTWSIATGLTDSMTDDADYNFVYGRHPDPGFYIAHDASPTSAANFEWFMTTFLRQAGIDYDQINASVAALPKAGSGVLFMPFLTGSNAGLGMKGGWYGLQSAHTPAHVAQAVYEGVIFSLNVHLQRIRRLFPQAEALRATGGPARSKPWMQILADLSGMPVELPLVEETGCTGAALAAAVSCGIFHSMKEAAGLFAKPGDAIMPDAGAFAQYKEKEQRYRYLVETIRDMEDRLLTQNG